MENKMENELDFEYQKLLDIFNRVYAGRASLSETGNFLEWAQRQNNLAITSYREMLTMYTDRKRGARLEKIKR